MKSEHFGQQNLSIYIDAEKKGGILPKKIKIMKLSSFSFCQMKMVNWYSTDYGYLTQNRFAQLTIGYSVFEKLRVNKALRQYGLGVKVNCGQKYPRFYCTKSV